MVSMRRILTIVFLLSTVPFSCKMETSNITQTIPKKQNKLEKTHWKSTASLALDSDVLLDFYTSKNVQEYITLPNGQNIKSKEGTYKLTKSGYLSIKWGKLPMDKVDGYIKGNELKINELVNNKSRIYYKIKDYF